MKLPLRALSHRLLPVLVCACSLCPGFALTSSLAAPGSAGSAPFQRPSASQASTSTVSIVSGDKQIGSPGKLVPKALVVKVIGKNGSPSPSHPVCLEAREGALQKSSIGKLVSSLTVLTDEEGQAKVFFQLPKLKSHASQVICSIGTGSNARNVTFSQSSDDGSGDFDSPFDMTNVVANMNPDGSVDVTWTNNTDPADKEPIVLRFRDRDGKWIPAATVPAGSTSCHIPSPQDDRGSKKNDVRGQGTGDRKIGEKGARQIVLSSIELPDPGFDAVIRGAAPLGAAHFS
jgi:hypothetical protein